MAKSKKSVAGGPILLATSNQGKFREMLECLDGSAREFGQAFLSLADLGLAADFEETGSTFAENALGKAKYYASRSGLATIAEDSGILVEALAGQLGVKTRRFGKGEHASDQEWVDYFLDIMGGFANKKAVFVCNAALVFKDGRAFVFEGRTEGVITAGLEAPIYGGLPLSSCFRPDGYDLVYAALLPEEKNHVSHRGKALRQISRQLVQNLKA